MSQCVDEVSNNIALKDLRFTRQLGGAEDLSFGFSTLTQVRNGQVVTISEINANAIPYTPNKSVKNIIDDILAKYPL